ncbi:MAG TPA: hypothetical protein VIU65_02905 [Pyrinomonadaceae bacterium]
MRSLSIAGAFMLLLLAASVGTAQTLPEPQTPGPGQAARTVKIGRTRFYYYEKPEAVAATTSFYISGSETKSGLFDFVALTVAFYNRGPRLTTPSVVRFNIFAATYRDGCKYRDKYANQATPKLHLNILADEKSLFAADLSVGQVGEVETRHGHVCSEMYIFEMTYEQFLTLLAARKAEMSLGTRAFKLKGDHLTAMRTMKHGIGQY